MEILPVTSEKICNDLEKLISTDSDALKIFPELQDFKNYTTDISSLLRCPEFRDRLAKYRYKSFYSDGKQQINTVGGDLSTNPMAVEKNLKVMDSSFEDEKIRSGLNKRVDIMATYAAMAKHTKLENKIQVLTIGPRSEYEVFSLIACLDSPVSAIDIFSYSDYIARCDLMDLSTDQKWDIIVMGFVLPYLKSPRVAIQHVLKCLKPGGHLIIGSSRTYEELEQWQSTESGGISQYTKVVFSTEDELSRFVEASSHYSLYEVARSCSLGIFSSGSLGFNSSIFCMYQKELSQDRRYTSRKGMQIPLRELMKKKTQ